MRRFGGEVGGPVQRRIAAAHDDEVLALERRRIGDAVEQLAVLEGIEPVDAQALGHEGAHASGDEHRPGQQAQALVRFDQKAPVGLLLQGADLMPQVELRLERRGLLHQPVDQLLPAAHRDAGDVVDRLVGVQLARLPAGLGQGVDDVGADLQQAQLEHRKQAHRAGADDEGVGVDGRGVCGHGLLQKQKRLAQVGPAPNRFFI